MTQNYVILDTKVKQLIIACKKTGNHKKIAVVGFILTSNLLDEIGIKLGLRARNKDVEKNFEYMRLINEVLKDNYKINIFKKELLRQLQLIEVQFLKERGKIPSGHITDIFNIYYELRKLDVPNLHKDFKDELISQSSDVRLYSLLSGESPSKGRGKKNSDGLKPLFLQKLREEEKSIQEELNEEFNGETFERAIYLRRMKSSIRDDNAGKTSVKGQLKHNLKYQRSLEEILGYFYLGVSILFILLGMVVMSEAIVFPKLTGTLSLLLIMFFLTGALSFGLYWNYFYGGRK